MEWAVGCQSDPHTRPGSTRPPILRVDTFLPPTVQKPCPPPQLGGLLWPQVLPLDLPQIGYSALCNLALSKAPGL
jgi:hypothetical protein